MRKETAMTSKTNFPQLNIHNKEIEFRPHIDGSLSNNILLVVLGPYDSGQKEHRMTRINIVQPLSWNVDSRQVQK